MIVSQPDLWVITAVVILSTAVYWTWHQVWRLTHLDQLDGNRHDIVFGAVIGLAIMLIGVAGVIKHYGG